MSCTMCFVWLASFVATNAVSVGLGWMACTLHSQNRLWTLMSDAWTYSTLKAQSVFYNTKFVKMVNGDPNAPDE